MTKTADVSHVDQRIERIVAIHFHPERGAPYWIDRARHFPFDPIREIRGVTDLPRLGFMDQDAMRSRPLSDFVPRPIWNARKDLIVVQTGGTLGEPIWTAYAPEEYEAAFVAPFVAAANHVGFPGDGVWLYVGPTGPHVIGHAARSIALATGGREPFTVDFDVRWAKRLPQDSFAANRYLTHVIEQALAIVRVQPITHLFSTLPVLRALASELGETERQRILGVHYGGLAITAGDMTQLKRQAFPNAVHLSGYGNTLFGCCLQLDPSPKETLTYFPAGNRLLFGTCTDQTSASSIRYLHSGAGGRCVFTRLDETLLIANLLERDEIAIVSPPAGAPPEFTLPGVADPQPIGPLRNPTVQTLY